MCLDGVAGCSLLDIFLSPMMVGSILRYNSEMLTHNVLISQSCWCFYYPKIDTHDNAWAWTGDSIKSKPINVITCTLPMLKGWLVI